MVWQSLGHTWPICGNGTGRPSDDMELIWGQISAICMLWKFMGKTGDAYQCMAEVWDRNIHRYSIALAHILIHNSCGNDMEHPVSCVPYIVHMMCYIQ